MAKQWTSFEIEMLFSVFEFWTKIYKKQKEETTIANAMTKNWKTITSFLKLFRIYFIETCDNKYAIGRHAQLRHIIL